MENAIYFYYIFKIRILETWILLQYKNNMVENKFSLAKIFITGGLLVGNILVVKSVYVCDVYVTMRKFLTERGLPWDWREIYI